MLSDERLWLINDVSAPDEKITSPNSFVPPPPFQNTLSPFLTGIFSLGHTTYSKSPCHSKHYMTYIVSHSR